MRTQRLGAELGTAVKRQSLRVRKPKSVVINEYTQAKTLNERLKYVVESMMNEYPYLNDKLEVIANTLTIDLPDDTPSLTDECACSDVIVEDVDENIAEKPDCP